MSAWLELLRPTRRVKQEKSQETSQQLMGKRPGNRSGKTNFTYSPHVFFFISKSCLHCDKCTFYINAIYFALYGNDNHSGVLLLNTGTVPTLRIVNIPLGESSNIFVSSHYRLALICKYKNWIDRIVWMDSLHEVFASRLIIFNTYTKMRKQTCSAIEN